GFQSSQHHIRGTMWHPDMEVIGTGGKALHHKMQQPGQTNTHGAADAAERDALTQQVFHHRALLIRNVTVVGRGHKLPLARFTLMVLLPMAGLAIVLVPDGSTRWARISDDHGCW